MTKYSRASCSAATCSSQKIIGKTTSAFFRFPLDEERCRLWCIRSGRKDLLEKSIGELHKKYYLCANHFSPNQFQGSSGSRSKRLRLSGSAIPSSLDCQSDKELRKGCQSESLSTDSLDNQNLSNSNAKELNIPDNNIGCSSDWSVEAKNDVRVGGTSSSLELDPPYLKVFIQHNADQSEPGAVRVSYQYHDVDGSVTDFESLNFPDKFNLEDEKDFVYEERGKTIVVKRSTITKFRQDHNFFGPLRAIPDSALLLEESSDEIQCTQLSMVDIGVTQKDDGSVNENELNTLLYQTPGIIPSCEPSSISLSSEDDYTVFSKGRKNFRVWNGAVAYFKQKTGVDNALAVKAVEEEVRGLEDKFHFGPVTILYIAPKKKKKTLNASRPLSMRAKRLQKRRKSLKSQKSRRDRNMHTYCGAYVNWAQRGSVCFSEIKKVGIRFIDELLKNTVSGSLQDFSSSLSTSAQLNPNRLENPHSFVEDPSLSVGSQDSTEERWSFLCNLAKNDNTLIEFQYNMDQEKWIEIKRNFNVFQIDGENYSDILLKVVLRNVGKQASLAYYLRCLGTLVKSGLLTSKDNMLQILKSFREDRYICIGFDKERFLYQSDENHLLRKHLKEHGHLRITPFESLHSKRCKAIVRDAPDIGNCKFRRGPAMIQGPIAICQPCEKLYDELEELREPTLESCLNKEDIFKPKQRFGPIKNLNVTKNIKKLCTETPFEFISDARREGENARKVGVGLDKLSKQSKSFDFDAHTSEDENPTIKISEEEFLGMLSIEMNAKGSKKLEKGCNKCSFQAKSMLSLFSHMSTHIETVVEECNSCSVKFSSVAALTEHKEQNHSEEVSVCSICQETSLTTLDFSFHMSSHRSSNPFVCAYCDQRFQTIESYKKHMKSAHNLGTLREMNFVCTICQTYFYTHDRLFIHALNNDHIEKSVSCSICKFSCDSVNDFQTHILNHTYNQREYHNLAFCSDCKKFFFSSYELEDHVKDMHKTNDAKGRVSSVVNNEKDSQAKNPKIFCDKCFKVFGTQSALQKHVQDSHSVKVIEEQPSSAPNMNCGIACNICGMKFVSSYFLSNHMNFHTANRPTFQCDDNTYLCFKRGQVVDNVVQNNHEKHVEKQQSLQQHQQLQHQHQRQQEHQPHHQQPHHHHHQHLSSYNHLFASQQQPFPDGQIPTISDHSQMVQPSDETTWNQPPNSATVDEAQNSVYSLLHL